MQQCGGEKKRAVDCFVQMDQNSIEAGFDESWTRKGGPSAAAGSPYDKYASMKEQCLWSVHHLPVTAPSLAPPPMGVRNPVRGREGGGEGGGMVYTLPHKKDIFSDQCWTKEVKQCISEKRVVP